MDVEQMRADLRTRAADGQVAHAERLAGVRARIRRHRVRRVVVSAVAAVVVVVVAVPVVLILRGDPAGPAVGGTYDGSYPGPETFDRLAVDGVCPEGGWAGSRTAVPSGPGEVPQELATALAGPLSAAVADAGGDGSTVLVERTATSLSAGAVPCGPSYSVYVGGGGAALDAEVVVVVSWAGDDRFGDLLACAPAEDAVCAEREGSGWRATVREQQGRSRPLVVLTASPDADPGDRTPVVAVRGLRGEVPDADGLLEVALAENWHRLAEKVEEQVTG